MPILQEWFSGPWGPVVIFFLRIGDVSLGTVRLMLLSRHARQWVAGIAFFEIAIWVVAAGTAINNLNSVWHILGYAGGFSAGSVVGMWLEERLAYGFIAVHIVSRKAELKIAKALRQRNFGVTTLKGYGQDGDVGVLFAVIRRRDFPVLLGELRRFDAEAFVTVEETRDIRRGWLFQSRRK